MAKIYQVKQLNRFFNIRFGCREGDDIDNAGSICQVSSRVVEVFCLNNLCVKLQIVEGKLERIAGIGMRRAQGEGGGGRRRWVYHKKWKAN